MDRRLAIPLSGVRIRSTAAWSGFAVAALATVSCAGYPGASELFDDDLVITVFDPEAKFSAYETFAIDPDVNLATKNADGSFDRADVDPEVSKQIVDHIVSNMEKRGYQQVDDKLVADLGISSTAISGLVVGAVSSSYWSGYYGSYWGFPGWSYYYPTSTVYTYQPGSLIVEMADLRTARGQYPMRPNAGESVPTNDGETAETSMPDMGPGPGALGVVWAIAAYRATVDDSNSVRVSVATAAIDQGFEQSPYLGSMQ